jgi:hypothetical protein
MIFFVELSLFLKIRYFKICKKIKKIKVSHLTAREQVKLNGNNMLRSIY